MSTLIAGERFDFRQRPATATLPEIWRDLDHAIWRWMLAHGADATIARAAAWVSHAEGQGHSALPLARLAEDAALPTGDVLVDALRQSPLVADARQDGADARPLILDGDHLYLARNHRAEDAVAAALRRRREAASEPAHPLSDADLRILFNGRWSDAEARQRDAVRQVLGKRLMVLTGGPGTGKTTTVLRMLLALSREHEAKTGRLPQVHIAAPTGKAAQRLSQSLRSGAEHLHGDQQALGADWLAHLQALSTAQSGTVHHMLGSRGRHGGYRYRAEEPLPADIVVVDEASMLDLGLLRALLDALREDTVLVLVGDADQLTSVGTGSVMMDIVQALETDPRDDLVRLVHCFRADITLVPINEAVRSGDANAFTQAMDAAAATAAANGRPAAARHTIADTTALRRRLSIWTRGLQDILADVDILRPVDPDSAELAAALAALRRQQLLCALREGPFGATQVAASIAARLRAWGPLSLWAQRAWYPGRAVIITRNDPAARLYNGDVGLCLRVRNEHDEPVLQVAFDPAPDASGKDCAMRLFDPNTLPPHEDAFALTVHKSQGSEYDHVAVLLPPDPQSPLLVRQTLYTGLSRARHSVELWSVDAVTDKAIGTALSRFGRLADRVVAGV